MRLDVRLVNAAAIQASVMGHLQEHMKYLAGNQVAPPLPMQGNSQASHRGPSEALGHSPAPMPRGPAGQTAQTAAQATGTAMPSQPSPAHMPRG
jgi:hypothetical protein